MLQMADLSIPEHPQLLCIGKDQQLLDTRRMVLESKGYQVLSIMSLTQVGQEALRSFNLVILCHTLAEMRSEIIESIRAVRNDMPILLLNSIYSNGSNDGVVTIGPGPKTLIEAVGRILDHADGTSADGERVSAFFRSRVPDGVHRG
jgi:hypothetical protein